jgi:beta-lactam-binding protein with PASTA domain
LKAANLKLGKVSEEAAKDEGMVGKVISQAPLRDTSIAQGGPVDITIAIKKTE